MSELESSPAPAPLQSRKAMGVGGYGYALGEKKRAVKGRNVAESLFLPLDGFVEAGSTKKISDLWALRERMGVIFLVEGIFNFFGSL